MVLSTVWIFNFIWVLCDLGLFHHTLHMSDVLCKLPCGRMYYSTLLGQYLIFTSLGIWGWFKVLNHAQVWISSLPFLIVILLKSVTACFPKAALIFSTMAKDRSLFLMIPLRCSTFMRIGFTLYWVKSLYFEDAFSMLPGVNFLKQIAVPGFFHSSRHSS